jgi:protein FAM50
VENLFRDDTRKIKKRKKAAKATLSFAMDDEDVPGETDTPKDSPKPSGSNENDELDEDGRPSKRGKFRKNPNVDTSFLPDREREEEERKERERLRLEWLQKQEDIKNEEIEVTYSFWDGSGHRKSVTVSSRCDCIRYSILMERRMCGLDFFLLPVQEGR